jgi:hypothetical protein
MPTKIRNSLDDIADDEWPVTCSSKKCGRIPKDGHHRSTSEGEGACSRTCAGRSHLPLRGKLGWMTPRSGQKRPENGMRLSGLLFLSRSPNFFDLAQIILTSPARFETSPLTILCAEYSARSTLHGVPALPAPPDSPQALTAGGWRAASGKAEAA